MEKVKQFDFFAPKMHFFYFADLDYGVVWNFAVIKIKITNIA
jgi:hypothetical protein